MGIALDLFRKRRYEEAHAQGVAQGMEQGMAQGVAQGHAERDVEWERWFRKFMDAQKKGIPFDEPPPHAKNGASRNNKPSGD